MSLLLLAAAASSTFGCGSKVPSPPVTTAGSFVTAADLVRLRDIGDPTYRQDAPGLSISPDGRKIAFQLREADPAANSYCLSILVTDADGRGPVQVVDTGGELMRHEDPQWGLGPYPSGNPVTITPLWSADGSRLAFLKRVNGHDEAWMVDLALGRARRLSSGPDNVVAIAWSADPDRLLVTYEPLEAVEDERRLEGLTGYRLDDRFVPVQSARPFFRAPLPRRTETVQVDEPGQKVQPERPSEKSLAQKWTLVPEDDSQDLHNIADVAVQAGIDARCPMPTCQGRILRSWVSADRKRLMVLRRTGRAGSDMAVITWTINSGDMSEHFRTSGLLLGCEAVGSDLICANEEATLPRRIVRLALPTGALQVVFDPNPEFSRFRLGEVRRLFWTNERGIETWGDLVLPPIAEHGTKPPLIVTSYRSRGFLRGGTGDEFPIQPFAAKGYAVLSFEEPRDLASFTKAQDRAEIGAINRKDWANRRSIQSSLEAGIKTVEALGVSDPTRRGITGLSEGATILWWSLINSNLFHAASVSSCCEEPVSSMALLGERGARYFEAAGYPSPTGDDRSFWSSMSVSRNVERIAAPILFQLADAEFRHSLVTIRALRSRGKPLDAYVFPGEEHIKWQPAHRLATYERNIAWFDFWLRGIPPSDPELAARWAAQRDKAQQERAK